MLSTLFSGTNHLFQNFETFSSKFEGKKENSSKTRKNICFLVVNQYLGATLNAGRHLKVDQLLGESVIVLILHLKILI